MRSEEWHGNKKDLSKRQVNKRFSATGNSIAREVGMFKTNDLPLLYPQAMEVQTRRFQVYVSLK